ncbi:MAG: hypothetical protein FJ290_00295 [Planctomycetes bacterium]|nr:hypothetical protein [Planctomycetota bacterium]
MAFVNGTGLYDVTTYSDGDYIFVKVTDSNYGTTRTDLVTTAGLAVVTSVSSTFITSGVAPGDQFRILSGTNAGMYTVLTVNSETSITLTQNLAASGTGITFDAVRDTRTVRVSSPTGDYQDVTLRETDAYSHVFMNTNNDLTTASSNVVTSASAKFETDGVLPGDKFVILSGPDMGEYTVQIVNSQTQITLTQTLTTPRTDIVFQTRPLLQAQLYDGSYSTTDRILEANNRDILTVTYVDGNPPGTLTDTATFGASPTAATVSAFRATCEGGRTVVEWETASEHGTVGFYLLRLNEASGKFQKVSEHLVPGVLTDPQGGTYRLADPSAKAGKTYTYQLIEVESRGTELVCGPYRVTVQEQRDAKATDLGPEGFSRRARSVQGGEAPGLPGQAAAKEKAAAGKSAKLIVVPTPPPQSVPAPSGAQPAIKIAVKEAGLYRVEAPEIAALLGIPKSAIGVAIRNGRLLLSCQGKVVPYLPAPADAGILFYGQPMKSIYTDENVYWLQAARGLLMSKGTSSGAQAGPTPGTFADTVHAEVNRFALTAVFSDPEADFWLWDYVYVTPKSTSLATKAFAVSAPDPAPTGAATLVVRLKGATATQANPDHHVVVALNGTVIGEGRWDGTQACTLTLPFDQQLLTAANTVTIKAVGDTGAPYSVFYLDSLDLTYRRFYLAVNGSLLCKTGDRDVVTIGRFSQRAISVFDVSDPWLPELLDGATVEEINGAFLASVPAAPGGVYYALTPDAVKAPVSVVADVPSRLTWRGNGADYVVIAPNVLMDGAKALASYRQAKRFKTMAVDLVDIYDEFNHGIANPHAIQAFLALAKGTWKTAPRYAVLAGNGTYDYKNYQGYGDNLLPPLMMATDYGLFASDTQLAPAGLAIGRLPAASAAEMSALVSKITAYEAASGEWTGHVVLAADKADPNAGSFPQDSDDLSGLVPAPYIVDRVYLSQFPIAIARAMLLADLNDGAFLLNYIGHGSATQFGGSNLLTTADVASLANGDRMPVVTAFTCLAARFDLPGVQCLGKAFVLKSGGGGIAFWGPSALAENNESKTLAIEFFRQVFGRQEAILGDAVLKASAAGPASARLYQLLGDPALRLRRPQ